MPNEMSNGTPTEIPIEAPVEIPNETPQEIPAEPPARPDEAQGGLDTCDNRDPRAAHLIPPG